MKKRGILLVLGGIILGVFIVVVSYAWYRLFSDEIMEVANLRIQLKNNDDHLVIPSASPVEDEEGKSHSPYTFAVTNTGNIVGTYRLIIEEAPFNQIDDGCTAATLLDRSQLRYQLLLNGKEVVIDDLDHVKNNVLDVRTIPVNGENNYELRIWLKEEATSTDWEGKHYHYSVNVAPVSVEKEG